MGQEETGYQGRRLHHCMVNFQVQRFFPIDEKDLTRLSVKLSSSQMGFLLSL